VSARNLQNSGGRDQEEISQDSSTADTQQEAATMMKRATILAHGNEAMNTDMILRPM
jgi:hypothetical protein